MKMLTFKTVRMLVFQINFSDERKGRDVYGKRKKLKAVKYSFAKRTQRNSENGRKSEQSGAEEQKITQRSG